MKIKIIKQSEIPSRSRRLNNDVREIIEKFEEIKKGETISIDYKSTNHSKKYEDLSIGIVNMRFMLKFHFRKNSKKARIDIRDANLYVTKI